MNKHEMVFVPAIEEITKTTNGKGSQGDQTKAIELLGHESGEFVLKSMLTKADKKAIASLNHKGK